FLDTAIQLTRRIRQKLSTPVIFGGIAATGEPEKCIRHADMVCLGEGEESMLEIAERIDGARSLRDIKNLWVRSGNAVYKNALYPLEQNLDRLPFPDYSADSKFWILNSRIVENDPSIGNMSRYTYEMMTSRGCPFSCTYCCNDILRGVYKGQKYLRRRSVENVINELKEAKSRYGIKSVLFKDEVFTFDINWIKEFAGIYKREIALPFWCYTYPLFAEEKILNLLKDCGMFSITMGIQSGSENILYNVFNRRTPVDKIVNAARKLESLKLPIQPRYDIITNNPFEEEEDCRETLELLMKLKKPADFSLTKLSFIPGSRITEMRKSANITGKTDERRYRFWNTLYLLTQYRFLPNRFIRALSRNRFLRRKPAFLAPLLVFKWIEAKCRDILSLAKRCLPKGLLLFLKRIRYVLKKY
ncbi:MAG: B12-binding domain-containing radical SAM protein, partial [Candidatus Omnitrophica bacterium]|nr:B12-binding domain-containing radical SAM protein [Candidatus Omnitrophota bacterium]